MQHPSHVAEIAPDRPAVIVAGAETVVSYGALDAWSNQVAHRAASASPATTGERVTVTATPDWSLPAAIDAVTDAVGDREMLVWTNRCAAPTPRCRSARERLAAFLRDAGLGVHRERADAGALGVRPESRSPSCCRTAPSTSRR